VLAPASTVTERPRRITDPQAAHALGRALRASLRAPLPGLLVTSTGSRFLGSSSPACWGAALAGLHGAPVPAPAPVAQRRPAAGGPTPALVAACPALASAPTPAPAPAPPADRPWAGLADFGDLAALPAALKSWGRSRVAVATSLALPVADGWQRLVLLAPDRHAYARLCRLLSWRQEEPEAWDACLHDGSPPPAPKCIPGRARR